MSYPRIRVAGSAYERGLSYGVAARDRIERSLAAYCKVFVRWSNWDWGTVRREAERYRVAIGDYYPAALDELTGLARGAGVGEADVLALNVRTELMNTAKVRENRIMVVPAECTALAAVPPRAAGGESVVGQNWDWLTHATETVVVLEAEPDDGPSFVSVVEAGLLAKLGLNEAGLGIVTNALASDLDTGVPAVPYHVVLRRLFAAATLDEAAEAVCAPARAASANYLVASACGGAVNLETEPGRLVEVTRPVDGLLLHTNHFVGARSGRVDVSSVLYPSSIDRLARVRQLLPVLPVQMCADDLMAALRDHSGHPFGICCHPDPATHPEERGVTAASAVMELTARRLWLAAGPPCSIGYAPLDYAGFLGASPN